MHSNFVCMIYNLEFEEWLEKFKIISILSDTVMFQFWTSTFISILTHANYDYIIAFSTISVVHILEV